MEELGSLRDIINASYSYLIAIGLTMPRIMGIVSVIPVFTQIGLTGLLRTGVVIAIALPLLPYTMDAMQQFGDLGVGHVAAVVIKEGFIGLVIGFMFGLPFWGIQSAGDIMDFQRGLMGAEIGDASQTSEASITATFMVLIMITLFIVAGGMVVIVETLYRSYLIWPILDFSPKLTTDSGTLFLKALDDVMRLAFVVGGPVIIAMFLGDAVLAAITRFAPQLNVFVLSMGVKCAIFVAFMPIYAVFILDYMGDAFVPLHGVIDDFERMIR
jgi:type III secretion protein T